MTPSTGILAVLDPARAAKRIADAAIDLARYVTP